MPGPTAGPTLGRYRLLERVTPPGPGERWRGVDLGVGGLERPVAIELLPATEAGLFEEVLPTFFLCHQNVLGVRDVGEIGGQRFVASEWVDGADVGTVLARLKAQAGQPLPSRFACLVGVEAARGLDYAHRARDGAGRALGLLHRALAPSCLFASVEGEVKVGDFGLWRLRQAAAAPYRAPDGGDGGDARDDVYALGALLYEMLAGQPPGPRLLPLRALVPTVPQGLEAIVLRAMAPAREPRYQTAAQMGEDLEACARRESYALSLADFGQLVRDLVEPAAPARAPTPAPRRLSGSRAVASPRAFGAALGGALAALGSDDEGGAETIGAPADASAPARPATVAVPQLQAHAAITPPSAESDERERPRVPTDLTELVPRAGRAPWWIAGTAAALVAVGGALWLAHPRAPMPATPIVAATSLPPLVAATSAQPAVLAVPPIALVPTPAAPARVTPAPAPVTPTPVPALALPTTPPLPAGHRRHAARAGAAHLTITSDVAADAFIDGELVRATPIVDLAVLPGRHVVRVESTAPGLRLIPREETVELRPGELKELQMVLK